MCMLTTLTLKNNLTLSAEGLHFSALVVLVPGHAQPPHADDPLCCWNEWRY